MTGKVLQKSIPKALHIDIWQKYEYGQSVASIQTYLLEHGIEVNQRTIYRLLQSYRQEKQEITKAIYANEVLAKAHSDLQIVDEMITSLYVNYQERLENDDHRTAIQYADSLGKYLTFRKDLMAGEQQITEAPKTPLIEQLLEKLNNVSNAPTNQEAQNTIEGTATVIPTEPDAN